MRAIIFQHTILNVLRGFKTETRRIIKPGQCIDETGLYYPRHAFDKGRTYVYRVGDDFSCLPGYAKKKVARGKCLAVWGEDVRDISDEAVSAEGFTSWAEYMQLWIHMHDQTAARFWSVNGSDAGIGFEEYLRTRPLKRYTCCAVRFSVYLESFQNLHLVPEYTHYGN